MKELTWTRLRRIQLILFAVVIIMLYFGGCGEQESDNGARREDMVVSLSGGVDISTMGTEEWREAQNLRGAGYPDGTGNPGGTDNLSDSGNAAEPKMEINLNESTVIYRGTPFMSSCRAIGGDSIYSTGFLGEFDGKQPAEEPYFAGRIGMEEDEIRQFSLEIPEDMFAVRGCVDHQGRWHLLLSQKAGETTGEKKTEIWVINRDGELEQSFDITECMKEGDGITDWIEAGSGGNYYFASGENILVIDAVNQTVKSLHFSGLIMGIGRGRSGALYGVFDVEGNQFLGIVDTDSGAIEKCVDLPENEMRPKFSVLQAGVNTELLLANKGDGIWSYDGTELKQELTSENIAADGQDILAMGFLWDGRACIMCYEDGHYAFYYEPIEV